MPKTIKPENKATDLPADWMIERAIEILDFSSSVSHVKEAPFAYASVINLAHYVGEHETAPVNPDLLIAREACAKMYEEYSIYEDYPEKYRSGEFDENDEELNIALRAIKLYKESIK